MNSGDYICSGTLIADPTNNDRSIVVTAGHCSYDAADGGFARNWTFYPEFDTNATYTCSQSKWGCWVASALAVHNGFAQAGGFNTQATTYDWSFGVIKNGGFANNLAETALGSTMAKTFSAPAVNSQTFNFGYPAAGKYHGYDLIYCSDQIFNDPLNSQPDVRRRLRHDRRLVGRTVARRLQRDHRGRHRRLGELVRLQRPEEGIRAEVQRQHLGHVQRGAYRDGGNTLVGTAP